jgi:putative nucleotidyltransferase with HDIG domain
MKVEDLIRDDSTLGSPPVVVTQLRGVIARKNSSADDIAKVIMSDGPLSARLLKLANSAMFGFPGKIDDVGYAVTLIGTKQVYSLAMATAIIDQFQGVDTGPFHAEAFWEHSLAVACAGHALAKVGGHNDREGVFLTGILHDLGRLAMMVEATEPMIVALHRSRKSNEPLSRSEAAVFNFDHTQAAKMLLERWALPPAVVQPVVRHHRPGADQACCLLHLADALVHGLAIGHSGEICIPPLQESSWKQANIKTEALKHAAAETEITYGLLRRELLGKPAVAA